MNQEWFTPKDLAGLPGMPSTVQNVNTKAKRDGWSFRKRAGRGGGREYSFDSLPVETQAALLKKAAPVEPVARQIKKTGPVDRESLWDAFDRKPQNVKDEAARRLSALQGVERLVTSGAGRSVAVQETAKVFGESRATLYRWQKLVKGVDQADWLAALVPSYQGRTVKAECSTEAWDFFKSVFLTPEQRSVAMCVELTKQAAKKHGWTLPSPRTMNRWVDEIPRTTRVLMREGELALLQLYPSQKRTVRDLHSMFWINGDGYKHNVFVRMPDGTIDRPKTWFWQDIYSRKIIGFRTDRTEHSDMIRLALGDVIERYGIPEHATIDNTRAAANKWLTAGVKTRYRFKVRDEDPLGLMPQLGIKVHWTTVHKGKGHGQAKPVERAFGVGGIGEYVDKHPKFAGAYTGPNVMAKPDNYGETAIDWAVFCEQLADCIRAWNEREGRQTEICAGQFSFNAAFENSYTRNAANIRRATDAQRRMWLLAAEAVLVQRDGSVALTVGSGPQGKNRYSCDALIAHIGRRVVVRFDPDSLHESVHVYQLDGRYIGQAECQHAAGFGDTSAGREWKRLRKQRLKANKAAAEAEVRMSAVEALDYLPDPTPEENTPVQTNVVRGSFAERKQVVGSDLAAEKEPESAGEKYRFDDLMAGAFKTWRDEQL